VVCQLVYQNRRQVTLVDQIGGDVLAKLKATKQAFERKQREKNKSFEELLNEYGNKGSKY